MNDPQPPEPVEPDREVDPLAAPADAPPEPDAGGAGEGGNEPGPSAPEDKLTLDDRPAPTEPQYDCPVCGTPNALAVPPPQSPRLQACPDCTGFGVVVTGSKTEDGALIQCERCLGAGYVRREDAPAPQAGNATQSSPAGEPPMAGMVWSSEQNVWVWPEAAASA